MGSTGNEELEKIAAQMQRLVDKPSTMDDYTNSTTVNSLSEELQRVKSAFESHSHMPASAPIFGQRIPVPILPPTPYIPNRAPNLNNDIFPHKLGKKVVPILPKPKFNSKNKLMVVCGSRVEYNNFLDDHNRKACKLKYTPDNTLIITHNKFNLAAGMDGGYYTTLEQFLSSVKEIDNITGYLQSRGFKYIPVKDL